jgi:hypothetical protein
MPDRGGHVGGRSPPGLPWQFVLRASMVVSGLTLLLIVDVRGVVFYLAWAAIGLALASETAAMLLYWSRSRDQGEG